MVANGRKRKQTIFYLEEEDNIITGNENLLQHVTAYYKNLFGSTDADAIAMNPDIWPSDQVVIELENESLARKFDEEEVKEHYIKWKIIKQLDQMDFQQNFFRLAGTL